VQDLLGDGTRLLRAAQTIIGDSLQKQEANIVGMPIQIAVNVRQGVLVTLQPDQRRAASGMRRVQGRVELDGLVAVRERFLETPATSQ